MSEDNLQESFLSFHHTGSRVAELRSSGLHAECDVSPGFPLLAMGKSRLSDIYILRVLGLSHILNHFY